MKTNVYVSIGLLVILIFSANQGRAEDFNRFGVGFRLSGMNIGTTNFETGDAGDLDAKFDNSVTYSLTFTYFLHQRFSVELSADSFNSDLEVHHDSNSGVLGEFTQRPFLLTGRMHFRINERNGNFFLGAGVGYYNNDFDNHNRTGTEDFFALNLTTDVKDSFGMHLCAGAEYFLSKHIALNFDVKMIVNQAEFKFRPDNSSTSVTRDVSMNASFVGIGFKYYY
ncbi:MAG: outer membrane beta-barrel protein [Proteobacteria bacterium]|nr:outer membrane beta-barrel protein [Pseudomonadota bacterium]